MKVRELIEQLQKVDQELPVLVGVACSCYGSTEATDVEEIENWGGILSSKEPVVYIS